MKHKWFIVAILLLGGLVVALKYTLEYKGKMHNRELLSELAIQKDPSNIIYVEDISEMKVTNPKAEVHFKFVDGEWFITEPLKTKADQNEAVTLAYTIASLEMERSVEKNPANLEVYGLENPDIKIGYLVAGEDKWHEIHFGRRSPIKGRYYAMDMELKEVFLVPFNQKFLFNSPLAWFRQKKIFFKQAMHVDYIMLKFPDKTYELAKDNITGLWKIKQPFEGIANDKAIFALFNYANGELALDFISKDEVPEDTGLDSPRLTIIMKHPQEGEVKISVGNLEKKRGWCYAVKNDENNLMLVHPRYYTEVADKFVKDMVTPNALRINKSRIKKIIFRKGNDSFSLLRPKI